MKVDHIKKFYAMANFTAVFVSNIPVYRLMAKTKLIAKEVRSSKFHGLM
jgi:hypothetical protein